MIGHYLAPNGDAELQAGLPGLAMPTLVLWGMPIPYCPCHRRESSPAVYQTRVSSSIWAWGIVVPEEVPGCKSSSRRDRLPDRRHESSMTICAPFSAIIAVGVLVLPDVIVGMTEASTTRSAATP